MMKILTCLTICVAIVTGCGNAENNKENENSSKKKEKEIGERLKINEEVIVVPKNAK